MKRILLLILALLTVISGHCFAQIEYFGPPFGLNLIAVKNDRLFGVRSRTIIQSTNGGAKWFQDNYNADITFSINAFLINSKTAIAATTDGIFQKNDSGKWILKPFGAILNFCEKGDSVFACRGNMIVKDSALSSVLLSKDGGITWSVISSGLDKTVNLTKIAITNDVLYAATSKGVMQSVNGGVDWTTCSSSLANVSIQDICVNNNYIYASSDSSGIYISSDKGATWVQSNIGLDEIRNLKLTLCSNKIFAASPTKGLFVSEDNGANWKPVNIGIYDPFATCIVSEGNNVYLSTLFSIFKSSDQGNTWSQINNGNIDRGIYYKLAAEEANLYASNYYCLYAGKDNGKTWEEINCLMNPKDKSQDFRISTYFVQGSYFLVSKMSGNIYYSIDSGKTWNFDSVGLGAKRIAKTFITNNDIFYAGTGNSGVFISKDKGKTWQASNSGISDTNITSFSYSKNKVYAVGTNFVYSSDDNGTTWNKLSGCPTNPTLIMCKDNRIYLATKYGLNYSDNDGTSWTYICYMMNTRKMSSVGDSILVLSDKLYGFKENSNKLNKIMSNYDIWDFACNQNYIFLNDYTGIGRIKTNFNLTPPTLISPLNLAKEIPTSITLKCQNFVDADKYRFQVAKDSNFSNIIINQISSTNSLSINSLVSGIKYYWRAYAIVDKDSSNWSETWAFTTYQMLAPTLLLPKNSGINIPTNVPLYWKKIDGVDGYHFQIGLDSNFSKVILEKTVPSTNYNLTALVNNTKYYWRVYSKHWNESSPWSETWSFTTTKLVAPYLQSPWNKNTNTETNLTLQWGNNSSVDSSRIQLALDSNFTILAFDSTTRLSTITVRKLANKTNYYWRVRAKKDGETSYWSETWAFTTLSPIAPQLSFPKNSSLNNETNIYLEWTNSYKMEGYNSQIALDSSFTNIVYSDSSANLYMIYNKLKNSTKYYWRVRSINNNEKSEWSQIWSFTTFDIKAPILSWPVNGDTNVSIKQTLKWKFSTTPDSFVIQVATDSVFTQIVADTSTREFYTGIDSLINNRKYFWRVKEINNGISSAWSEIWSFTTIKINAPELTSPKNNSENQPLYLTLTWKTPIVGYGTRVQVAKDSSFKNIVIKEIIFNDHNTIYSLLNNTKYYWRVQVKKDSDWSEWSDTWSFTTVAASIVAENLKDSEEISISPNPASGAWTINYKFDNADAVNIAIYNILGEQVLSNPNLNSEGCSRIDISGLYSGAYHIVFEVGGRKIVRTAWVCK